MRRPHHHTHKLIRSFEAEALKKRPIAIKIADFLTSRFGSVSFLLSNLVFYGGWAYLNSGRVPGFPIFDPYPYSFMNSFVSIEALTLTVIVLMSQNRSNERAMLRSEFGLQVELFSEKELTKILILLKKLLETHHVEDDPELEEMTKEIDTSYIERKLEEQLTQQEKSVMDLRTQLAEKITPKK